MQRKGLGRGLSALIPAGEEPMKVVDVAIDEVFPNPRQPRRRFDEAALAELADSIKEHGLLQPVIVRRVGAGYELVAGERRLRAAKEAGLKRIPAIIRGTSDSESLALALVENLQRENLDAIEEARALRRLIDDFGMRQEELARMVGKSRSAIANSLRLLSLPDSIQSLVQLGAITAGHARAVLSLDKEEEQLKLVQRISERGLSVRQAEALARKWNTSRSKAAGYEEKDEIARAIARSLGARVAVRVYKEGKGRIEIRFSSLDELERLKRRLAPDAI
mgnify:CR=1 FL=1